MKRKLLAILTSVLLLCGMLPFGAMGVSAETEGEYSYSTTYNYGMRRTEAVIEKYTGGGGDVVIPSTLGGYPVTELSWMAFKDNLAITSVVIPQGVTLIDEYVFSGCTNLKSVTFPYSLETILASAFYNTALSSVTIPSGVLYIQPEAFLHCRYLKNIEVSAYNKTYCSIDGVLFDKNYWGTAEKLVQYPGGKDDRNYTVPDGVITIGESAFYGNAHLTSVTLPKSVTTIESGAFRETTSLTTVTIPDSVTTIGDSAFASCFDMQTISIPKSVTSIGDGAFFYCVDMTAFHVDSANPKYCSIDGVLFDKDKTTLIQYPGGKSGSYTVPYGVTTIGEFSFTNFSNPSSITIPDSVTTIEDSAFACCSNLSTIKLPDSITHIGSGAFDYCGYYERSYNWKNGLLYIGKYLIAAETSITGACNIKDDTVCIADNAFYFCRSITSVTIPNGITTIGEFTFYNCTSLTSVTIPDSVTSIEKLAFKYCTSLTDVYYTGSEEDRTGIMIDSDNNPLLNATWHYNYKLCAHSYDHACDPDCNLCGETRKVGHVYGSTVIPPTCDTNGSITHTCHYCGDSFAGTFPALGHVYDHKYDVDCNECGDVREVPDRPVEILYGDTDGDGEITSLDVLVLQQYFAGYEVTLDEVTADVNGDGEITVLDVILLQQFFAGYDVNLGSV